MSYTGERNSKDDSDANDRNSGASSPSCGVTCVDNPSNAPVEYIPLSYGATAVDNPSNAPVGYMPPPVNTGTDYNATRGYNNRSPSYVHMIPYFRPDSLRVHYPLFPAPMILIQQVYPSPSNMGPDISFHSAMPGLIFVPGVNYFAQRSIQLDGSDLPYNDIRTLQYFFNLGVEWVQMTGIYKTHFTQPPMPYYNNRDHQFPDSVNQSPQNANCFSSGASYAVNNNINFYSLPKADIKINSQRVPLPNVQHYDFGEGVSGRDSYLFNANSLEDAQMLYSKKSDFRGLPKKEIRENNNLAPKPNIGNNNFRERNTGNKNGGWLKYKKGKK